jgi:6-pyruvoyltetrahydropterin/6-carboxytetrahydropterin synthase
MIINQGICPVCEYTYSNMMNHLVREKDGNHKAYLGKINDVLDPLILKTDLYTTELEVEVNKRDLFVNKHYISQRIKKIEPERKNRILSSRRMGENNPVHTGNTIDKIRETVKGRWIQGCYKDRINGMLGITGEEHPNYKPEIHTPEAEAKKYYRDFLAKFEDISTCRRCNSKDNIDIHHIDEDHDNILLSNLEPLCVLCHGDFYFESRQQPFVTISKSMSFAAAHQLPHHLGKCESWHGHEWVIEISIRKRIDPATMMVMDFKDLKVAMKTHIIDVLDHNTINDIIAIPTAENILVWCWERLMFDAKLKGILQIKIWESPDSCASIDIEGMLSVFKNKVKVGSI